MKSAVRVAALALVLAACGSEKTPRTQLHTPGASTGQGVSKFPLVNPTPTPTPTPEATPKPEGGPVTSEEKRIIRGWSDELRAGHVDAASRYFTVPSLVQNGGGPDTLVSKADVKEFNATLTCGAKLVKTRRGVQHFVIGTFELTELPRGSSCTGTGELAEVAILISRHRITQWVRIADPKPKPKKSATPQPADET